MGREGEYGVLVKFCHCFSCVCFLLSLIMYVIWAMCCLVNDVVLFLILLSTVCGSSVKLKHCVLETVLVGMLAVVINNSVCVLFTILVHVTILITTEHQQQRLLYCFYWHCCFAENCPNDRRCVIVAHGLLCPRAVVANVGAACINFSKGAWNQ